MTAYQGRKVRLDGSASRSGRAIVSYRWVQTAGTPVRGLDPASASPEIILPFVDPPGENLQFTLTVADAAGASDTDTVKVKVLKYLYYDDFRINTTKWYALRHVGPGNSAGEFRYVDVLGIVHAIPGFESGLAFSHEVPDCDYGTFSFVFTPTRYRRGGGRIRVRLLEDGETYYEMFNGSAEGSGGLRKVLKGREVDRADFGKGYSQNLPYPVKIVFRPGEVLVDAFGELARMNGDRTDIVLKRFEIFTEGQEAYFDNLVLSQDPFIKLKIPHRLGLWDSTLSVEAIPGNMPDGARVRFVLDADGGKPSVVEDADEPFEVMFHGVSLSSHVLDAYLLQGPGTGVLAHDRVPYVARDGYYVAVGDSITEGSGDGLKPATTTHSPTEGKQGGYVPALQEMLESAKGYPHTIVNEGVSGHTSAAGLAIMPSLLKLHPDANYFLILYGTNDSGVPVPSGKGLRPGDEGYARSFKDNMQRILSLVMAAGKTPVLGKVPIIIGVGSVGRVPRFAHPDHIPRNLRIREYNSVIDELVRENRLPVPPPDFYRHFRSHPREFFFDGIHPNDAGYRSIAKLWLRVLTR